MSCCLSLRVRALRLGIAAVGVLIAGGAYAQVELPPIPFVGEEPPEYSESSCLVGEYENPNYDAWDPCCNPPLAAGRPSYCPAPVTNPINVFEAGLETTFGNLLRNVGLEDLLGGLGDNVVNWAAGYLAGQVVSAAWDFTYNFLNGNNGSSTGAGVLTVPALSSQLSLAGDRLTSVMLTTIAAISDDPLFQLETGAAYRLPFVAGPTIKSACQESSVHRDRSFDLGVMNGTANNGVFTFTTQAGVPTEIKANRPSWTSRQIWDFRWLWWFGDGVMVPQSAEHDAYTVHTYPFIGNYALSFVMLKNDVEFWIFYSSGSGGFSWSDLRPGLEQTDHMFPDACNYGTMQVVANRRPTAMFTVGPTNIAYQLRFTASPSYDPDGNPLAYLWVLEDGSTTRARTFTKMYPPGTSTVVEPVQLTVSDGAKMHTATRTIMATPSNCEPVGPFDPIAGGLCGDDSRDGPPPFP